MIYLFAQGGYARLLPRRFPQPGFFGIPFIAPSVKLSPRHPQLLCQGHNVFAASQSFHCHLPEVLRIPSLCHSQFPFLQSVSYLTVSFLGFTPTRAGKLPRNVICLVFLGSLASGQKTVRRRFGFRGVSSPAVPGFLGCPKTSVWVYLLTSAFGA